MEKVLQVLEKMHGGFVVNPSSDKKVALTTAIAIIKAAQELAPDLWVAVSAGPSVHAWLPVERRAKVAEFLAQVTGDEKDIERARTLFAILSPDPKPQQEV